MVKFGINNYSRRIIESLPTMRIRLALVKQLRLAMLLAGLVLAPGLMAEEVQQSAPNKYTPEEKQVFSEWVGSLIQKVKRNWLRPPNTEDLVVLVELTQTSMGEITRVRLKQSSGVPEFDDSAIKAVYKSNPLPILSVSSMHQPIFNIQLCGNVTGCK